MSFLDTLSQMSALFLMVLIGYGCNRLGYMDKDFNRKFSSLILNVTAPFLSYFSSFLLKCFKVSLSLSSVFVRNLCILYKWDSYLVSEIKKIVKWGYIR